MAKRSELCTEQGLDSLYLHHPYLAIFQKEDWKEYLLIFANLYDLLEDENTRVPFEVVRSALIKYYAQKQILNLDVKIHNFFNMAIGELQILRDSHDQFGQRYIETTRSGKLLLQLIEGLINQRTRFSGTGAETLLGALNDILLSRNHMSQDEAVQHHKDKIKAFQEDLKRIQEKGIAHAELLPIAHSNEALFSQAEEAASYILSSIEDVKTAIERQRQDLAQTYFEGSRSAGKNLNAIASFYELLYLSPEYSSYIQAKHLLSYLEGFTARFSIKNVDQLLFKIRQGELLPPDDLQKSQLQGFTPQFTHADHSIQNKVKDQIKLLQQQVYFATSTDVQGLQSSLHKVISSLFANKGSVIDFFEVSPLEIDLPTEFDSGPIALFDFEVPTEVAGTALVSNQLEEAEQRALFLALLQAEETTLQDVLKRFRSALSRVQEINLRDYRLEDGLAEYYVLSEIELFDRKIVKRLVDRMDLEMESKYGDFILRNAPIYVYSLETVNSDG